MTPFVQPCDAGIIRCFKAIYRRNFCSRAIELDEAGERNIYKLDILDGITMAKQAWNAVTSETIKHCWDHTEIQSDPTAASDTRPHVDPAAWKIVRTFATT
ncbi:hypothetical protein AZE42_14108, partial [Rhizopogon vesiculosus]